MYCLQSVALSDPYLFAPYVLFGQLIHTVVGLFAFSFVLEYVKMMKASFFRGMLCCAQRCIFIDLLEFVFFGHISMEASIIDMNFNIISLWGMDIACMYESLVCYR